MLFSDYHLAKLNPQMSYELFGLFVTEIGAFVPKYRKYRSIFLIIGVL